MNTDVIITLELIGLLIVVVELAIRKKIIVASLLGVLFLAIYFYGQSVVNYLSGLGADSYLELLSFDNIEAIGFIKTLSSVIIADPIDYRVIHYLIFAALLLAFLILKNIFKPLNQHKKFVYIFMCLTPLVVLLTNTVIDISNNVSVFMNIKHNFKDPATLNVSPAKNELKTVIFVGESTSILNLSLYGYSRETTPLLDKLDASDSNFLKFNNVFSTHVHTVPSLLEVLSLPIECMDEVVPIEQRSRVSLVDILKQANVETHLISNQSKSGSWNIAAPILFENSDSVKYSIEGTFSGNEEYRLSRPEEFSFFKEHLQPLLMDDGSAAIFLHSYIGHYYYKNHLPKKFQSPVDNSLKNRNLNHIFGNKLASSLTLELLEKSDSSYKYLDYVLSSVINIIRVKSEPVVLMYFSDHGDAPYAGLAHDSSRFQHEMARVPFVIYFNDKAKNRYNKLYQDLKLRSESNQISTLASFSKTLLELFDINSENSKYARSLHSKYDETVAPILVRQVSDEVTFVNPFPIDINQKKSKAIDATDFASHIFKITSNPIYKNNLVCYHRSNSMAKAVRGSLVSNCLEIDIFLSQGHEIYVDHDHPSGPLLDEILNVVEDINISFWLDGKNIDQPDKCEALYRYFEQSNRDLSRFFIEFPSSASIDESEFRECVGKMIGSGLTVSYYIPTELGMQCLEQIASYNEEKKSSNSSCADFDKHLNKILKSKLFTDISFDIRLFDLIKKSKLTHDYRFNAWGIAPDNMGNIQHRRFDRLIIDTHNDPNGR